MGLNIRLLLLNLFAKNGWGELFQLKVGIDYLIDGLPTTLDGARLLAEQDKKDFEIWAVARVDGIPNEKKGADKGIDGSIPLKPNSARPQGLRLYS